MFEITATKKIDTRPERVWNYLVDVREWWLPSNPEHQSLEILSAHDKVELGTKLRIRERIAGVPGEATGSITEFFPGERATWEAKAQYRLLWLHIPVEEGVTWSVRPVHHGTELAARVWARFPNTILGKVSEWVFVRILNGRDRDRQHAETELEYVRVKLEEADRRST